MKYAAIWVLCGYCGKARGIGKSENSVRFLLVLHSSDGYDACTSPPATAHNPPARERRSKQSKEKPRWCRALDAAMPLGPAPMTQTRLAGAVVDMEAIIPSRTVGAPRRAYRSTNIQRWPSRSSAR